ncbi:MAG: hypothetical protein AAFO94_00765 [Bacteroidota bacterium]
MSKAIFSIIGFSLFIVGMMALVFSLVGIQISFLTWMDAPGRLIGLILRLVMIVMGIVVVVLARSNWQQSDDEPEVV